MAEAQETQPAPIIIINKRRKKTKAVHHGGAWKVAYADFVTAMMAFFLLMWLLNVTSVEQKKGIANYFSPLNTDNPIPAQQEISLEKSELQTFEPLDDTELETNNQETRGPDETEKDRVVNLDGNKLNIDAKDGKIPEKKLEHNPVNVGKTHHKTIDKPRKINEPDSLSKDVNSKNIPDNINSGVLKKTIITKHDMAPIYSHEHPKVKEDLEQKKEIKTAETTELKKTLDEKNKAPETKIKTEEKKEINTTSHPLDQTAKTVTSPKMTEKELQQEKQRNSDIQGYAEEKKKFDDVAKSLKQAIQDIPELKEVTKNLVIDMTEEGMRIQIVDELKKPMFASGSPVMYDYTKKLMANVGKSIAMLPNKVSISGHTDSVPYNTTSGYSNWELSSDRAHASRRVLVQSGIRADRIISVIGKEDKEPLFPDRPTSPENRRISLTILFDKKLPIQPQEKKTDPEPHTIIDKALPPVPTFETPIAPAPTVIPPALTLPPIKSTPEDSPKIMDISEEGSLIHNSSSA